MFHAGRISGFLLHKQLIYKASLATGDYREQMHVTNCEKWAGWHPKNTFQPSTCQFFFWIMLCISLSMLMNQSPLTQYKQIWYHGPLTKGLCIMILWAPESGKSSTKAKRLDLQNCCVPVNHNHTVMRLLPYVWLKVYGARMGQITEDCAWKVKADKKLQKLLQDTNDSVTHVTNDDIKLFCKYF
jgi:hypothetical protein